MKAALTLPHKFKVHKPINMKEIENKLEKTLTQARWALMNPGDKDLSEEARADEVRSRSVYDVASKTLDFTSLRPTELKTCPRYNIPEPNNSKEEEALQVIRSTVMDTAFEYITKKN